MNIEKKRKAIYHFRWISIAEGISFLLLLFVAMPLKYMMEMPFAVTYMGWIHGLLFIAYVYAIFPTRKILGWNFRRTLIGLLMSVLPFGPFLFDRKLRKDHRQLEENPQRS
ncbi:DUF3817 domain-containing protein [Echinicola jeungdonensis]|uniref:DUF3817 domain-containing protein n=1 Tax=Echinicola jeungdonensis TaxID=709343 RepID=A0ABV5J7M1_9BACT|nr:DUF3817 domain-containing protein [Echinicola jeungdonensis]MDN3671007.1 DUF3817 domain-containing protein [Echinicola jeungdonensis]